MAAGYFIRPVSGACRCVGPGYRGKHTDSSGQASSAALVDDMCSDASLFQVPRRPIIEELVADGGRAHAGRRISVLKILVASTSRKYDGRSLRLSRTS